MSLHREAFAAAKAHLLDDSVNCIRMPSSDPNDCIVLWSDASASAISCLLTQQMEALTPDASGEKRRHLHIIGCWSSVIQETWKNYPIWLLELIALWETCRKFRWLLSARPFWAVTDSSTVVNWASLDAVPKDLARKIIHLQKFQYRVLFVESRLNPADAFSRLDPGPAPEGEYPRFLRQRIFNSRGEAVPWERLFSERKSQEAKEFFQRSRKQTLSAAVDITRDSVVDGDEEDIITAPDGEVELESTDYCDATSSPHRVEDSDDAAEIFAQVAMIGLDDDDLRSGRCEETEEEVVDVDIFDSVEIPQFSGARLEFVRGLQENDEIIVEIRRLINGDRPIPPKIEALSLPLALQQYLRHRSNFRVSSQGVLLRLWAWKDGTASALIVVGKSGMERLITETHSFDSKGGNLAHLGQRKTMEALSRRNRMPR